MIINSKYNKVTGELIHHAKNTTSAKILPNKDISNSCQYCIFG
jgi:hypothetical protein